MEKPTIDHLEFGRQLRRPSGEPGINTGQMMNQSNRVMYDDMLNLLFPEVESSLLEIGFGNGLFLKDYFAKQAKMTVTGIDFSETMIAEAEKNNIELLEQKKLSLLLGDAASMPFSDASFDFVVTINTLYFWASPADQLQEIKRVLKSGGKFLLGFRPKEAVKDAPFTKEVFTLYDPEEVDDLLRSAGFYIEKQSLNNLTINTAEGKKIDMPGHTIMASKT